MCANCGATGHDQIQCSKAKVELSERPCFICKKPGHPASKCPTKGTSAKFVEGDGGDDEMALALESEDSNSIVSSSIRVEIENSFDALAADSDDESNY